MLAFIVVIGILAVACALLIVAYMEKRERLLGVLECYQNVCARRAEAAIDLQAEKDAHDALKARNRETIDRLLKAKETVRKYQNHGHAVPGVDLPTQRHFAATVVGMRDQRGEYRYSFICARSP